MSQIDLDTYEGRSIQCNGAIYKVINGKKCLYPSPDVFLSYGQINTNSPPRVYSTTCNVANAFPSGPTLTLNTDWFEQKTVNCAGRPEVYRIISGQKCHYPNPDILNSYGAPTIITISCDTLDMFPTGPDVPLNPCGNAQAGSQLSSLCQCQQASNELALTLRGYNQQLEEYALDLASYNRWSQIHAAWQSKTSVRLGTFTFDYSQYNHIGDVSKFWSTDGNTNSGGCWGKPVNSSGATNGVCVQLAKQKNLPYANDYVDDGNRQSCGCCGDPAGWFHEQWECTRPQSSINNAMAQYNNAEPKTDLTDPNSQVWLGRSPPQMPTLPAINIQCCSQMFNNINASSIEFSSINQNCSLNISNQIKQATAPVQPTTQATSSTTTQTASAQTAPASLPNTTQTTSTTSSAPSDTSNLSTTSTGMIVSIVLCIVFILFIIGISIFAYTRFKKK